MDVTALVLLAVGVFVLCGAWFDWNWFMDNYKARRIVSLVGRNGARVFYTVVGLILAFCGLLMLFGGFE